LCLGCQNTNGPQQEYVGLFYTDFSNWQESSLDKSKIKDIVGNVLTANSKEGLEYILEGVRYDFLMHSWDVSYLEYDNEAQKGHSVFFQFRDDKPNETSWERITPDLFFPKGDVQSFADWKGPSLSKRRIIDIASEQFKSNSLFSAYTLIIYFLSYDFINQIWQIEYSFDVDYEIAMYTIYINDVNGQVRLAR